MNILEIVKIHLQSNGFDGLVHPDNECGCELCDLQPCGEDISRCLPAYKHDAEPNSGYDFLMSVKKREDETKAWDDVDSYGPSA